MKGGKKGERMKVKEERKKTSAAGECLWQKLHRNMWHKENVPGQGKEDCQRQKVSSKSKWTCSQEC